MNKLSLALLIILTSTSNVNAESLEEAMYSLVTETSIKSFQAKKKSDLARYRAEEAGSVKKRSEDLKGLVLDDQGNHVPEALTPAMPSAGSNLDVINAVFEQQMIEPSTESITHIFESFELLEIIGETAYFGIDERKIAKKAGEVISGYTVKKLYLNRVELDLQGESSFVEIDWK